MILCTSDKFWMITFHLFINSSLRSSSHSKLCNHSDCRKIFGVIIIGESSPSGSKIRDTIDKMCLLVFFSASRARVKQNWSFFGDHFRPSVFKVPLLFESNETNWSPLMEILISILIFFNIFSKILINIKYFKKISRIIKFFKNILKNIKMY